MKKYTHETRKSNEIRPHFRKKQTKSLLYGEFYKFNLGKYVISVY